MNLNYLAFFLIAFVPLIIAGFWYHPKSPILRWSKVEGINGLFSLKPWKIILFFLMSYSIVYGYMNLIIHQLGFYELFFTDIMLGNEESKKITEEFLAQYGDKHRHLGHGVFHGVINAFVFAIPFIGMYSLLERKTFRYFMLHFSYWLVTSMVIGGLISEFV